ASKCERASSTAVIGLAHSRARHQMHTRRSETRPSTVPFDGRHFEDGLAPVLCPEVVALLDAARVVDELERVGLEAEEHDRARGPGAQLGVLVAEQLGR